MPDYNAKIRAAFNQFDRIIIELDDSAQKHTLVQIKSEMQGLIENLSIEFVKGAVDYYIRNIQDEPFYQKVKKMDKEKTASQIKRSRSYVYNAIRKKSFTESEIRIIQSMMEEVQ